MAQRTHITGRPHVSCAPVCHIAPPHILAMLAEEGGPEAREAAIETLSTTAAIHARRAVVAQVLTQLDVGIRDLAFMAPPSGEANTVYDVQHGTTSALPGERKRGRGDPPSDDESVNQAFDGAEATYRFYREVLNRDSVDGQGLELVSSVHYGNRFDNAFWNGSQMVYGDGSGQIFQVESLTSAIDVIAHELTHGVTQFSAALEYSRQSGALNESFSDVFGSLVKQYGKGQSADQADWLIGEGIVGPVLNGVALRSMKAPGTANAYDNQPAKMSDYADLPDDNDPRNDNGGVHINSGIPNHAFYLVATDLGGNAWEKAGTIWYDTLTKRLEPSSDFQACASATLQSAEELFGAGGAEHEAVGKAWSEVGVL